LITGSETREVVVLSWGEAAGVDRNAHKIATFMGAEAALVSLLPAAFANRAPIGDLIPRSTCLVLEAETLAKTADASPAGMCEVRRLIDSAEHVLVYGFRPEPRHEAILRDLSSDSLTGVQQVSPAGAKFHVAENHRTWCAQFSGLTVGSVDPSRDFAFAERAGGSTQDVMIRAGEQPFFVRFRRGEANVFVLACTSLADLDEKVQRASRPQSWFSRLAPLMMVLRGALQGRVWQNQHPKACFIIDDPLLKSRHGFLEFRELLDRMSRRRFSACIAFIPWNYRRSNRKVAAMISSSYGLPFLCVHGCDHTDAEFAATDVNWLRAKAQLALERMRAHHRASGVAFDDVMVFPQGRFSAEAITALKASGYLAAVNGAVCPSTAPEALALRDLVDVAVTKFADFPVFGRRYPRDLADFAFDVFLGRPALGVEHHGYFRRGYAELESFVEGLNLLAPRLEWTNLATICSEASVMKMTRNGDVHVRFFTHHFRLKNHDAETRRYLLFKKHTHHEPLPSVTINGKEWFCESQNNHLCISLELEAGQSANIQLHSNAGDPIAHSWKPSGRYRMGVWIRRFLGEVRDNYLDRAKLLSSLAATARSLRRSGKSAAAAITVIGLLSVFPGMGSYDFLCGRH
jgi:hypothetical protein